jgi:AAA ATPase domain
VLTSPTWGYCWPVGQGRSGRWGCRWARQPHQRSWCCVGDGLLGGTAPPVSVGDLAQDGAGPVVPNPANAIRTRSSAPNPWSLAPYGAVSLRPVTRDNPGEMGGRMASPTFVGRLEELETLEVARARAADGDPAVVLVGGEAGIGKTRLIAEFTSRCAAGGTRVLVGGYVPVGDGTLPYAPGRGSPANSAR